MIKPVIYITFHKTNRNAFAFTFTICVELAILYDFFVRTHKKRYNIRKPLILLERLEYKWKY